MKALTIHQPWASLIMAGAKPFEFRGWHPPVSLLGQRIVIHASARNIDRGEASLLCGWLHFRDNSDLHRRKTAETCLYPDAAIPILQRAQHAQSIDPLPMACGLGTAIVGVPRLGTDIAAEFGVTRANDSELDEHAIWGWPMLDIEVWPEPIPMRGKQGLWNWPTPTEFMEADHG